MDKSTSRNVNRYLWAVMKRRALAEAFNEAQAAERAALGALKGKQVTEAQRLLRDLSVFEQYPVAVKVRRQKAVTA